MRSDLPFACTCGALTGTLVDVGPDVGTRAECFCVDCRAAELFKGQPDPAPGGVQLFQTTPDRVRFDSGADKLGVFSLSPKGLLRWHATCCGAVLFNTVRTPKLAFAAFRTDRLAEDSALGPIIARAHVTKPNGKTGHEGGIHFLSGLLRRSLPLLLTGGWRKTPFFDPATRAPVAEVYVLTPQERAAATPG